jgi:hypothetical protein
MTARAQMSLICCKFPSHNVNMGCLTNCLNTPTLRNVPKRANKRLECILKITYISSSSPCHIQALIFCMDWSPDEHTDWSPYTSSYLLHGLVFRTARRRRSDGRNTLAPLTLLFAAPAISIATKSPRDPQPPTLTGARKRGGTTDSVEAETASSTIDPAPWRALWFAPRMLPFAA